MRNVIYFVLMCLLSVVMFPFIIREKGRENRKFLYDEWKSARRSFEIDMKGRK